MGRLRYFFALFLTSLHVPVALFTLLLKEERRRPFIFRFYKLYSDLLLKLVFGLKVHYQGNTYFTPPPSAIYISNHQSYFDIPLICTRYQIPPIMKAELMRFPGIGQTALLSGAITVSRGRKEDRKRVLTEVLKRLDQQDNVFYFPEGTRSKTGRPMEYSRIHTPVMKAAYERGIPVLPVAIYNTDKVIGKNLKIMRKVVLGHHIGNLIHPKDFTDRELFCQKAWEEVEKGYASLESVLKINN